MQHNVYNLDVQTTFLKGPNIRISFIVLLKEGLLIRGLHSSLQNPTLLLCIMLLLSAYDSQHNSHSRQAFIQCLRRKNKEQGVGMHTHVCVYIYIYAYIYIYRYICMYVCMYVCMCVRVCMRVHATILTAHIYKCMCVCMYACMHACLHACIHACMYVCMHPCMYV